MRLKQIKLAGFKSFVDVTKVPFNAQMTAIVGPNGCGKSNIIDAVRWVLGESSAKNLRGDAMTDVIFNGAASRKPVGQASVELVFENQPDSAQKFNLSASLSERNEISIRRTVNRDGQNHYYLNGAKCRRRDITDVFLGSGLGPKSYAIIEQGMISRLIESKPQELRVFVEEAAGVSKYKERRRETESKLKSTRENIERLEDISQEINHHLVVLNEQAEQAQRFRELKVTERNARTDIAYLKQQKAQTQLSQLKAKEQTFIEQRKAASTTQVELEKSLESEQESLDLELANIDELRNTHNDMRQQLVLVNHQLSSAKEQQARSEQQKLATSEKLALAQAKVEALRKSVSALKEAQSESQPLVAKYQAQESEAISQLNQLQQDERDASKRLQQVNQAHIEQQQVEIARNQRAMKIAEHITRSKTQQDEKNRQLQGLTSDDGASLVEYYQQKEDLAERKAQLEASIDLQEKAKQQHAEHLADQKAKLQQTQQQHFQQIAEFNSVSELLAKQEPWQPAVIEWLGKQNVKHFDCYYQHIQVPEKWQAAANKVLANWLQAIVVENMPYAAIADIEKTAELQSTEFQSDSLPTHWIIAQNELLDKSSSKEGTLAAVIDAELGILPILNNVLIADSTEEAVERLPTLLDYQAIVTPDGTVFNKHSSTKGSMSEAHDVISLNHKRHELEQAQHTSIGQIQSLTKRIDDGQIAFYSIEQELANTRLDARTIAAESEALAKVITEVIEAQNTRKQQRQKLVDELADISAQLATYQDQQAKLEEETTSNTSKLADIETSATQAEQAKQHVNEQLAVVENIKQLARQTQDKVSQQTLELSQLTLQLEHANEQVALHQDQLSKWQDSNATGQDVDKLKSNQHELSVQESIAEKSLIDAKARYQTLKTKMAERTMALSKLQQELNHLQDQQHHNALKIEQASFELKAANETLNELEGAGNNRLALSSPNKSLSALQQELKMAVQAIQRLGAVNLAAIDECQLQQQRKNQIDLQIEDLTQALATLESAIAKIDRESRTKFKATFEQINQDFKQLFPKVFGGGEAYLALTSDDLLETGVTIMARPPGKKNSTIHLLSGGEKALTALSLVFAIFRLTPAPFCMLDEVDAPLDDANVERFCNLVQEMSKTVQFIYISHNKIAMEMASHLTGVTMGEPGVSRMVSVDIDEAIAMAEVS